MGGVGMLQKLMQVKVGTPSGSCQSKPEPFVKGCGGMVQKTNTSEMCKNDLFSIWKVLKFNKRYGSDMDLLSNKILK